MSTIWHIFTIIYEIKTLMSTNKTLFIKVVSYYSAHDQAHKDLN